MSYQKLDLQWNDGLVICRISDPPANLVSQLLLAELDHFLDEVLEAGTARAVILTAAGEVFSGGGNLVDLAGLYWNGRGSEDLGNAVFNRIERFPIPVLAAIQGDAFGGGVELLMSCHLRVMADSAHLKLPELQYGFIPGWGGTQRLPRIVGRARAYEMYLSGDTYTADQARAFGLVNAVVPAGSLMAEAEALARRILRAAPEAVSALIRVVSQSADPSLEVGLELERDAVMETVLSRATRDRVALAFPRLSEALQEAGRPS